MLRIGSCIQVPALTLLLVLAPSCVPRISQTVDPCTSVVLRAYSDRIATSDTLSVVERKDYERLRAACEQATPSRWIGLLIALSILLGLAVTVFLFAASLPH